MCGVRRTSPLKSMDWERPAPVRRNDVPPCYNRLFMPEFLRAILGAALFRENDFAAGWHRRCRRWRLTPCRLRDHRGDGMRPIFWGARVIQSDPRVTSSRTISLGVVGSQNWI